MRDMVDRVLTTLITTLVFAAGYTVLGIMIGSWAQKKGYLP